jgi:20S proteasome alpha/beta subunit
MAELKEHYSESMSIADAEKMILKIHKGLMEECTDKETLKLL